MRMNIRIAPIDDISNKLDFSVLSKAGLAIRFTTVPVKDKRFIKLASKELCKACNVGTQSVSANCKYCGGTGYCKVISAVGICYKPYLSSHVATLSDFLNKHEALIADRHTTTVELKEFGGFDKDKNVGKSTIICGLHGEKLRCAYSDNQPNGTHAVFYVTIALVVNNKYQNGKHNGTVSLIAVDRLKKNRKFKLSMISRTLFKFSNSNGGAIDYDEVTNTKIEFPEEAVRAAMQKAVTADCTTNFYCLCSKGKSTE